MPGPHRSIPPITLQSSSETYQAFRTSSERAALGLVLAVVLGLPLAIFGYRAINAAGPTRVIELTGRLPTTGMAAGHRRSSRCTKVSASACG